MLDKDKKSLALEHYNNAYKMHLNGNINEAIELYRKSIKLYPTAKAHTFLGWALSMQGKFDEAIEECLYAIDLQPDFGNPYNDIGSYLISQKKLDDAKHWLTLALDAKDYAQRHFPLYNLGLVYEKKGDYIKAQEFYIESLKISPEYEAAKTAFIRMATLLN